MDEAEVIKRLVRREEGAISHQNKHIQLMHATTSMWGILFAEARRLASSFIYIIYKNLSMYKGTSLFMYSLALRFEY
jgi:hypothetical protein